MTPEQEQLIRDLSAEVSRAREIYESHTMMNTPVLEADRIKAMQEFSLARTRFLSAKYELERAMNDVARSSKNEESPAPA